METAAMKILKTLSLQAILFWENKISLSEKKHVRGISHLSWIRLCQKQLCKGLNSKTFSSKIELKKIEIIMLNRGTHVLHFWEKVREFYGNLNEKKLCENKKFWGAVKPTLSNKVASNENITLVEQDNIVENDKKSCNISQQFFLKHHN